MVRLLPWPGRKKKPVTTEPLVHGSPSRDEDLEAPGPSNVRNRSLVVPPTKKKLHNFPPQWRERQCIMTTWTYYSFTTMFLVFWCPWGAFFTITGGMFYDCKCCMPKKEVKGMKSAFCIYVLAFVAMYIDLIAAVIIASVGAYYLLEDCPIAETLCDLRTLLAFYMYLSAFMLLMRSVLSFNIFLSMRDYRREMKREELLEKRINDELEANFKAYRRQKMSLKSQPSTSK